LNGIAAWIIVSTALLIGIIALLPRLMLSSSKALRIGDRVRLSGGHQDPAPWLQGRPEVYGRVTAFISRGNSRAVEVAFESPFSYEGNTYPFAELRLLFKGASWSQHGVVHVELWTDAPTRLLSNSEAVGHHKYVESHASYRVMGNP
jgi:hypothetical protein